MFKYGMLLLGLLFVFACSQNPISSENASSANANQNLAAQLPLAQLETKPLRAEEVPFELSALFAETGKHLAKTQAVRRYYVWQVALQGNSQGRTFQRQGSLVWTSTITNVGTNNGVNLADLFLISGEPATIPQAGAIWFATNTAMYDLVTRSRNGAAQLDLVSMAYDDANKRFNIQPDTRIAAASFLNYFNSNSGLTANVYLIKSGLMQLQFPNNAQNVAGYVNFIGTGYVSYSNTPYAATFSGTYQGYFDN